METEQNNPYHCYSVGEHTLAMLKHCEADPVLRWTALLHDIGKPLVKTCLLYTSYLQPDDLY